MFAKELEAIPQLDKFLKNERNRIIFNGINEGLSIEAVGALLGLKKQNISQILRILFRNLHQNELVSNFILNVTKSLKADGVVSLSSYFHPEYFNFAKRLLMYCVSNISFEDTLVFESNLSPKKIIKRISLIMKQNDIHSGVSFDEISNILSIERHKIKTVLYLPVTEVNYVANESTLYYVGKSLSATIDAVCVMTKGDSKHVFEHLLQYNAPMIKDMNTKSLFKKKIKHKIGFIENIYADPTSEFGFETKYYISRIVSDEECNLLCSFTHHLLDKIGSQDTNAQFVYESLAQEHSEIATKINPYSLKYILTRDGCFKKGANLYLYRGGDQERTLAEIIEEYCRGKSPEEITINGAFDFCIQKGRKTIKSNLIPLIAPYGYKFKRTKKREQK